MANEAETAVQNYLLALDDPDQLRDDARLDEVEKKIESAKGLEKLKLLDEHRKLETIRPNDYVGGFIKHAKTYAKENDIDPETFRLMGVSKSVLEEAFGDGVAEDVGGISADEVDLHIKRKRTGFTVPQVEEETGASSSTVRKVVKKLVDEGEIKEDGTDPDHEGRGRAATFYVKA